MTRPAARASDPQPALVGRVWRAKAMRDAGSNVPLDSLLARESLVKTRPA